MKTDMDFGIPLPDGTRLSARVWIPDGAESEPVPAILEYLPYRKSDGTTQRDDTMHPWFAAHGYACLRVDRRGCGDSDGIYDDEYSEQELRDGEDLLAWIADQTWCNGKIGMQGISWGGFNGLQLAARRPDALKAVISIGTTVNRFTDDIHFKGGIQLGENIGWAATSASWFSTPPDPHLRSDWRERWLERLETAPFLAERWTAHADYDAYWKHGSVCESYDAFEAAVLVIGGQHDGYRNAMAAMLENAAGPVQAIMGPWSHKYPHISTIGPSMDYLNVALRWWDKWLKGVDNGAEQDPAYRVYAMDSTQPDASLDYRSGEWLGFENWPSTEIEMQELSFCASGLGGSEPFEALLETDLATGQATGEFFPFGLGPGELPDNQALDDARSVCIDSAAFEVEQTLIGAPVVKLTVSCSAPRGQIVARLNDVRPDGSVALISLGMLDLRYRAGFDGKVDLTPGEPFEVEIKLDQCAYRLPKGHKLRVALSTSYWPFCWPEGVEFSLHLTGGAVSLPVLTGTAKDQQFDLPEPVYQRPVETLKEAFGTKEWSTGPQGEVILDIVGDHGKQRDLETGLVTQSVVTERWSIDPSDPQSAAVDMRWTRGLGRDDWSVKTEVMMRMRGKADAFVIQEELRAWDGEDQVFEKKRQGRVER